MDYIEILIKFLIAFILTFLFGYQRQKSHKPIGFGTFVFVSIGSCGLAITATEIGRDYAITLLGAIVTGIGFLGAGALIKSSDKIFGFTTASSIWLFAIFGLIVGLGKYYIASIIYIMIWCIVFFDNYLEREGIGSYRKKITITSKSLVEKKEIINLLGKYCSRISLINISIDKNKKNVSFNYLIDGNKNNIENLVKEFYSRNWCSGIKFE